MLKIGFVGPYKDFIDDPDQVFALHNENEAEWSREEFELVHIPLNEQGGLHRSSRCDAYISGGLFYHAFQKKYPKAPLTPIRMQGCDLYHTLLQCQERTGCKKIGMIAAYGMLAGIQDVLATLKFDVELYDLRELSDCRPLLAQAVADGCDCILSGHEVCGLAGELGVAHMLLRPRMDSFYISITEAKRLARQHRKEAASRRGRIVDHPHWQAKTWDSREKTLLLEVLGAAPAPRKRSLFWRGTKRCDLSVGLSLV